MGDGRSPSCTLTVVAKCTRCLGAQDGLASRQGVLLIFRFCADGANLFSFGLVGNMSLHE